MEKRMPSPLTVGFDYTGPIADGDRMKLVDDKTVARVTDPYDHYVGQVYSFDAGISKCTLVVPYTWHRDDRVAGVAGLGPGYGVLGADNKIYPYTPAKPARHDGTAVGPVTVVAATSDAFKLKVDGVSTSGTLDPGEDVTFATILAAMNAALTGKGVHIELDTAGHLNPVADEIGKTIEIEAIEDDCYTLLGWTAGVYYPVNGSHDPTCAKVMVLTTATDAGDTIETLEM